MGTFDVAREVDAAALAAGLGLDDEGLRLSLLPALVVGLQVGVIVGQAPGDGEELVVPGELLAEVHECSAEVVLAGEDGHAGEVVDLLVGLHAGEEVGLDVVVGPADVEVEVGEGIGLQEPAILLGDVLDHRVLSVCMQAGVPLTLITNLCFLLAHCAL